MRFYLGVWATTLWFVMFATGTAHADVPRTIDGNGVLVGSWIAPVQLEIFCEPQCPHCAEFGVDDGDRLAAALASGRLAITYRWLTFLDEQTSQRRVRPPRQCAVPGGRPDDVADGVSGFRARPLPPPECRRPEQR